jgi:arsenical pump membrane protein
MVTLVIIRPRLGWGKARMSPALAAALAVTAMLFIGAVDADDLAAPATELWRPFVAIASIMVMTEVAASVGLLDWWAALISHRARTIPQLFRRVFILGVVTATALNNDAAILLLTPLVVALVRRRFPHHPRLAVPFAFAVFIAAGVAPMPISNPMNMVVAAYYGIAFNEYCARMVPIALVSWLVGYAVLRWWFRALLNTDDNIPEFLAPPASAGQRAMMILLAAILVAYSVLGYLGARVWMVALGGALAALAVAYVHDRRSPLTVITRGVSWDTLGFLLCVLIVALGLRHAGLVDALAQHYADASIAVVAVTSALGSAVLNNHPMAYVNMLALEAADQSAAAIYAALVGGDLGPRLLPIGSLAGLLWMERLHHREVEVSLRQFITVGTAVTAPALGLAMVILWAYALQ